MTIPKPKFKVTTFIRSLLMANADIMNIIGNRIFPVVAPTDTAGTLIVYWRDSYSVEETKMGVAAEKCHIWIEISSDDYDESQNLAELVYLALYGEKDNYMITLKDSTEDLETTPVDKKYIQVLLFEIS